MERIKPRTLSGFMELLPPAQQQFEQMLEQLRQTYANYGFTPLDTPVIESAEILLAKGGGETEKQIYRFTKGDSDLALRFDLTVPLAKYVALHYSELTFPFRRYQIGKVYRGERAQRRRQIGHQQRGGNPRHHLPALLLPGPGAVLHPRQQPQTPQRLLHHPGPRNPRRRNHAHRG